MRAQFSLPTPFAGCRIWGRVSCKDAPSDPACATYTCTSASGPVATGCTLGPTKGKVTLFEIHLGKTGTALDFYDVSLVDAYNLPINIIPVPGSYAGAPMPWRRCLPHSVQVFRPADRLRLDCFQPKTFR